MVTPHSGACSQPSVMDLIVALAYTYISDELFAGPMVIHGPRCAILIHWMHPNFINLPTLELVLGVQ